jgi:glycerol-3-phosphate O-acyltransferase
MGNWKQLILSTPQLLECYQQMTVPSLKVSAGSDIVFEDLQKEAVLAVIFLARTLFDSLGMKIKYRGLDNLRGRRVAFVANHQGGNLDALVIACILFAEKQKTPFIPTSNRLLEAQIIGKFSEYLKYVGPFFIRTSFKDDEAYMTQVLEFMNAVLDARQYLLFFLEGDTSRGGKPRPPKRGLIKSLVKSPLVFCPISITYESALNDTGIESKAFHVQDAVTNLTQRRVGNCYVTFGKCIDSEGAGVCHKQITERLATAVYSEIPILTVDLIAMVLLDGDGLSLKNLTSKVEYLELYVKSCNLSLVTREVEKALPALSHLVSLKGGRYYVLNAVVLNFYRNRAIHAIFDLAEPPTFLKYECCWRPSELQDNAMVRAMAVRAISPLITSYQKVIAHIGSGRRNTKDVLSKLLIGQPCCTLDNILQILSEMGVIRVQGHDVITL